MQCCRHPSYRGLAEEREGPVEYFGTPPPPPLYSLGSTKAPNYYHTPPAPIRHHENREFGDDKDRVQYYRTPPPSFFPFEQNTGNEARNRDFHQPPPLPTSLAGLLSGAETPPWERQEQEVAFSGPQGEPTQPPWANQPPQGNLGFMPDIHKVSWPPREGLYQQPAHDAPQLQNQVESLQPRELEYSRYSEHGQRVEKENAAEETKVTPKPFKPSVRAFLPFSQRIDPESAIEAKSRSKPPKKKKAKARSSNRRPRTQTVTGEAEVRHVPQLFTKLAKPRSSSVQIVATKGQSPISSIVNFLRENYLNIVKPVMPRGDVAAPSSGLQDDIVFALSAISSIIIGSVLALPS